jgi:hypothetical protein
MTATRLRLPARPASSLVANGSGHWLCRSVRTRVANTLAFLGSDLAPEGIQGVPEVQHGGTSSRRAGAAPDLQDGQGRRTVTSMVDEYQPKVEYGPTGGVHG